jgi:hypothetical protein
MIMNEPKNKLKLNRTQIREALEQLPMESIIRGEGKKRAFTKKQEGFIKDVAMGKPKAQAYRDNYNTNSKKIYQGNEAFKLASNPKIANEIEAFKVALLAKEYQKGEQLKAFIMHQLTQHALNEDNPPSSRIRSLELLGKTYEVGLFVERKEVTTINNSSDIKAKLIEQLKEAMSKNAITIEHDSSGESLLDELRGMPGNLSETEPHAPPTPQNEPSATDHDMHSIPHKQSTENEKKRVPSVSQDIDSKGESDVTVNVYSDEEGGGGIKNPENEEQIATENTPVNDLKQKG